MKTLVLMIFLVLLVSMTCQDDEGTSLTIFKTRADYSKNVPVLLSIDKSSIIGRPGELSGIWPIILKDSFYLNGTLGLNTGYLSLTFDEYNQNSNWNNDSLYKFIIDVNPYTEFYYKDNDRGFYSQYGAYGVDTGLINDLISKGNLENYFKRLK
ncbi:MAG TPA: hypothetical protein VK179_18105 [Bacteroidales bacterium]|nr:hypothetical protein [Bacteroidales bacterium]